MDIGKVLASQLCDNHTKNDVIKADVIKADVIKAALLGYIISSKVTARSKNSVHRNSSISVLIHADSSYPPYALCFVVPPVSINEQIRTLHK